MNLHEPNILKVRTHQIAVARDIPPIKVMLTGDWHISPIVSERQLDFLNNAISQAEPDFIILQGDLVDSPTELQRNSSLKKLRASLSLCAESATTVLVLGSHDFITSDNPPKVMKKSALAHWKNLCNNAGVSLLLDDWFELDNIRIFGAFQNENSILDADHKYRENPKLFYSQVKDYDFSKVEPSKVNWFAAHAPYLTKETLSCLEKFDVLSFGHTHGGIIPRGMDELLNKLHLHFGLVSPNHRPFPRKVRGAFQVGDSTVEIVNAGMVGAQFCAPKIAQNLNFVKAAEIDLVTITGTKNDNSIDKN